MNNRKALSNLGVYAYGVSAVVAGIIHVVWRAWSNRITIGSGSAERSNASLRAVNHSLTFGAVSCSRVIDQNAAA